MRRSESGPQQRPPRAILLPQPARFLINGLLAAAVHFALLAFLVEVVLVANVGLANMLAAVAGSCASFIGNRYLVFCATAESALLQLGKFWMLYAATAVFHGVFLYVWTDLGGWDYRFGFIIGAGIQTLFTYAGGRWWVFKQKN